MPDYRQSFGQTPTRAQVPPDRVIPAPEPRSRDGSTFGEIVRGPGFEPATTWPQAYATTEHEAASHARKFGTPLVPWRPGTTLRLDGKAIDLQAACEG
jgi:hypothetical protein